MKVINLLGAPSSGKTTTMLGIAYYMKMLGLSIENTPEFFKELILEGSDGARFGGQGYIFGEQNKRLARCVNSNDFVVTDCPLPLIGYYTPSDYIASFDSFVMDSFNSYDNINYMLVRNHNYELEKRNHSEKESDQISAELPKFLSDRGVEFNIIKSGDDLALQIVCDLIQKNHITKEMLNNNRVSESILNRVLSSEKLDFIEPKKISGVLSGIGLKRGK